MFIINMLKTVFRVAIGAALLPLAITISRSFYAQTANISILDAKNQVYFLWGAGLYVIMHLFFFKPKYIYNLGHESVHAISAFASMGKAKNMKVSKEGGSVETTKSNFFISISPYFIPLYTILLCAAYFFISKARDITPYEPVFILLIGFTLAMHIIMTVEALKVAQPDLIKTGYLFSLALIYVLNIIITAFVISLIFPGFSFADMFLQFWSESKEMYILIFNQLFGV